MGYFDSPENVRKYMEMVEDYDGRDLIEVLKKYLEPGSSLLELGMGPGKDLDILKEDYRVAGTDSSKIFIDLYKKNHPDADVFLLDAVSMRTDRKFHCIFSNKVLHHLRSEEIKTSLENQHRNLHDDGILFHTFWYGDKEEEFNGLRFLYLTEEQLRIIIPAGYEIIQLARYTEMAENDSIYTVLKKI